jgi:hypothetical protein
VLLPAAVGSDAVREAREHDAHGATFG